MGFRKLTADIRNGDADAFELFYRMEFNNIVHFINSYTHDIGNAEDLAQEVFGILWEKRGLLDPDRNLRSFVYRIAKNRTLNALKEKTVFADGSSMREIDNDILALEDPSVEELIDSLELERQIENIYSSLPDSARSSFEMSRKEGLTNKEIAYVLGLSVKAIEYHIKISLKIFRKKLKEYLGYPAK